MDDTKSKILSAAADLFALKGFAGTSISDIAGKAGIHQSLIYHHIGNKQALWKQVKEFLIKDKIIPNEKKEFESFQEFLKFIFDQRFNIYASDPRIARIIKWQALEESPDELTGDNQADPVHWIKVISDLQAKKKVSSGYPAGLIALFIYSTFSGAISDYFKAFSGADNKEPYINMLMANLISFFVERK